MTNKETRSAWIFLGVAAAHYVLTILLSLAAWALQEGSGSSALAQQPLRGVVLALSWMLNFPIPFILRDNSLLIMLGNSALFAILICALWAKVRVGAVRKK